MRIDIHTHTRKVKAGDAETRNIETKQFIEIIKSTDVKILAITNHNHFDLKQYENFREGVANNCQIWPGIELDISENGKRAHLLVVCNPKNYQQFGRIVDNILKGKNPDSFTISIAETVRHFDPLDCIYVAHYRAKKPDLEDEELEILVKAVSNSKRILKEASNSISAGIYISHGHNSIFGSDVQNWQEYVSISKTLPELRLPVESFEQFCLLLEKDEATINTLLAKKQKENIEINPFNNVAELVRLDIYSDINILFGSKGTGKTEILEALSRYFNSKGYKTSVFKSNDLHLNEVYDLRGRSIKFNYGELGIEECEEEIEFIKGATESEVTSLAKYTLHFSEQERNKISQKLKIKNITKEDESQPKRKLKQITDILEEFRQFKKSIESNELVKGYIEPDLIEELIVLLDKIVYKLLSQIELKFIESKTVKLLNGIIDIFNDEISKKTGRPQKPTKTGFADYAGNRIKIEIALKKIIRNIKLDVAPISEHVGALGAKGELYCETKFVIQHGTFSDGSYIPVKKVNKTPQKDFSNKVDLLVKHIYSNSLFEKIAELNRIEGIESISCISDLLLFCRHFTLDGEVYQPSHGESSMILLYRELKENKEIYLIDEPEKSLGNDYISEVIVPLLKEKALLGKKVIIATHDANIAVRTLPYNSIYRLRDKKQYYTMTGNPFSNSLKCIYNSRPELNWKEISMKTLEGGIEAFGERGKIYGN